MAPPPLAAVDDGLWAPLARDSRDALALLGYCVGPKCLPDETDPCGGTFAQHAAAHFATLKAVIDHHLGHLSFPDQMISEIYEHAAASFTCEGDTR